MWSESERKQMWILIIYLPIEFGEKRIIEFMSNESEQGDDDSARFRLIDARRPARGLLSRDPSMLK